MLLFLVLAASPLADATRQYADLEYEACVTTLASTKSIPAKDRASAELLLGLCHFALGHEAKARTAIESSYRRDPAARPPTSASPKELAFIEAVRSTTSTDPQRPKRTIKPTEPKLAEIARPVETADPGKPETTDAPKNPDPAPTKPETNESRPVEPVALLPPPPPPPSLTVPAEPKAKATWLPWVTAGVAVIGAGTGAGLGLNARAIETRANAEPIQLEAARLAGDAQVNATAANVAFAVAGTAAVATVITFILTR